MNTVVNDQRTKAGYPILTPTVNEGKVGATSVGGRLHQQDNTSTSREDLSEFVRTQPVFDGEQLVGLKLLPGTNASRLASLGVQPGDVIRSVEGKQIKSDAAWQRIDDALSSGSSIVVGIERDGSLMSISLDGARLVGDQAPPLAAAPQDL